MLYPAINELIKDEGQCRYSLVIAVAKKARMISAETEANQEKLDEKPIKLAILSFSNEESTYKEISKNN